MLRRDPLPPYDPQPLAPRKAAAPPAQPPTDDEPPERTERATGLVLAVLLDASSRTLSGLGLTRPSRLPLSLAVFGLLFFVLGLPEDWMDAPLAGRTMELGDWNRHVALTAFVYEVLAVFVLSLVSSRGRVSSARREVPEQTRRRLLAGADSLLAEPVTSQAELTDWMRRQDAWLRTALRDLKESISPAAADGLRHVGVDEPVRFRHRFNDVHDAALGLLARRAHYLQTLNTHQAR